MSGPIVTPSASTSLIARIKRKLDAAWQRRAKIRRSLVTGIAEAAALVVAFQFAFPEVSVEHSATFASVTRVLTGLGTWLVSKAMLHFTGEDKGDDPA